MSSGQDSPSKGTRSGGTAVGVEMPDASFMPGIWLLGAVIVAGCIKRQTYFQPTPARDN